MNPNNHEAPQQVRDWVEDKLREAILDGQLKPGEWLRQLRVANQLGVSELPVREALKKLAAEGLVEYFPYRGMRVRVFSADDIGDIYKIRTFLEGMAAYAAAENITPEELDELRALATQIEERLAPEYLEEHRKLNRRFHEVIFTASRRAYLVHALNQLWMVFPSMLWGSLSATANKRTVEQDMIDIEEHRAIISALENRNATEAERAMRQHIEDAGNRLLHILMNDTNSAPGKA
ncbi:MAG: GntR family transcriptional regulator [Anaerolineales bacterium]|jgi:DNA-binding GntR family transcriptional regulator|nr:GntR family transcriptional regulator [Anaerolineales bacterium]